ncbi:hypothetical protein [Moorena bouillonii]|uniref:Uncharacterized protein n=1 Tax=Moorena bouillonii PNG TaxID=568701 RepID=A0A1U7NAH2_9CYAN|nr:hypothetical protein [Moorena bouillonii]OLT62935.1 hypothetical protein BJP37_31765 [Moorena bouillonii PNG]
MPTNGIGKEMNRSGALPTLHELLPLASREVNLRLILGWAVPTNGIGKERNRSGALPTLHEFSQLK